MSARGITARFTRAETPVSVEIHDLLARRNPRNASRCQKYHGECLAQDPVAAPLMSAFEPIAGTDRYGGAGPPASGRGERLAKVSWLLLVARCKFGRHGEVGLLLAQLVPGLDRYA